jgi:uncharacterized DUF497 family protein
MNYHELMIFDWDDTKAESNRKKHGVSFAEAATAFSDPHAIEVFDGKNSDKEERWILVGLSAKSQVLLVVFVEREEETIRIVSARKAVKDEINQYFAKVKT